MPVNSHTITSVENGVLAAAAKKAAIPSSAGRRVKTVLPRVFSPRGAEAFFGPLPGRTVPTSGSIPDRAIRRINSSMAELDRIAEWWYGKDRKRT